MKLVEFTMKNYKSLREFKLEFGNYTALVGENGSGKTSVLEALYLFFKDFNITGGVPFPTLHEATSWHSKKLPLEFIAEIVLDEEELREIFPEDVLAKIIEKREDRHRNLAICRRILGPGAPWETVYIDIAGVPLVKDNVPVSPEELAKSISKGTTKRPAKKLKAFLFDPNVSQSNLVGHRLIVLNDTAYHMDEYTDSLVREGKIPFEQLPGEDYKAWVANQGFKLVEKPPAKGDVDILLIEETPVITPRILQNVQKKIVEKIKGKLELIPATRNERIEPGQHLPFLNVANIVNPLANLHASDDETWYKMKTAIQELTGQELDSVPTLTPPLCTWEKELRLPVALIGGGQQEVIGLAYQVYTASEPIIAIEEPETHLHHNLSKKLFKMLRQLSESKQLIVATHSECFAEISEDCKNWLLLKKGKETKHAEIKSQEELLKAFGSLGAEPSDRGYPNKILFVAGETEEAVLPVWAQTQGVDIKNVRIQPLAGEYDKHKIQTIKDYIEATQTRVFLMVDSHASDGVKQAVQEESRLILKGTIEDCYPIGIVVKVLNENFGLDLVEGDIDAGQPRVDEIKRILKEKREIPRKKTFWKRSIGKEVAEQMTESDIPEEIKEFLRKVVS